MAAYMSTTSSDAYFQEQLSPSGSAQSSPVKSRLSPQYTYLYRNRNLTPSSSSGPSTSSGSQWTPPLTPQLAQTPGMEDDVSDNFHNYIRAFYHFHPSSTISSNSEESSITVPINQGDVILVHSIQPNGWADGTILTSGARGWLPTNYCNAYDHDFIRNLLDALTYVWEFIRLHEEDEDLSIFVKQDYVRSMIAGVRLLLERSNCLTREAELVKSHLPLRKLRKNILGDLAAFVKAAKFLGETCRADGAKRPDDFFDYLDALVLKAFKVVTRSVSFLDVWTQEIAYRQHLQGPHADGTPPLTPASDHYPSHNGFTDSPPNDDHWAENEAPAPVTQVVVSNVPHEPTYADAERQPECRDTSNTISTKHLSADARPTSLPQKRLSACHRLSHNPKSPTRNTALASERLSVTHDAVISNLATVVGLVETLRSRSSIELLISTQQSVTACQALLAVVDEVYERDSRRSAQLDKDRDNMHDKLAGLVQATRDIFRAADATDEWEPYMPREENQLKQAATLCVSSAGSCVTTATAIIERIGDFDFDDDSTGLGISNDYSDGSLRHTDETYASTGDPSQAIGVADPSSALQSLSLPVSPSTHQPLLNEFPSVPSRQDTHSSMSSEQSRKSTDTVVHRSPSRASSRSQRSHKIPSLELEIPPVSPLLFPEPPNSIPTQAKPTRTDSVGASVAESSSTGSASFRNSKASITSDPSTCATSPDRSQAKDHPLATLQNSSGSLDESQSTSTEDCDATEAQLLTTTYAQELIFNKDGQISGGSLPALIEQLTTHDSTPDAMFVNTFYLTFRLFTTPADFAQGLVDRFKYVCQSPESANPVRLRVYNVFKGWLESHWQPETDAQALGTILDFANDQLKACLPSARKRLVELVNKVTTTADGPVVPRLVSALGKTNIAGTPSVASDTPIPSPVVTKSQLNLLKKALSGAGSCSILDFDSLELARQFTIIESKLFCSIQPEELLASEWTRKEDSKAVNVRAMSTLSTDLANLVADTILQPEEAKKRALVLKQWVKIAKRCRELNNYDSLLAIICSLNSSMVSRLKRTWELLSPKTMQTLDDLRSIVDCSRNYATLRQMLQNHVAPCIPFVGIYLTDLTFVDVGNQTKRQLKVGARAEGANDDEDSISVINFDKHMKTAKIIGDLQRFQIPYRFAVVPEMQEWMEAQIRRVRLSEEANVQTFYRRSLLLEPRETQPLKTSPAMTDPSSANTSFSSTTSGSATAKESSASSHATTKEKFEWWSARHFPHSMGSHKAKVAS